MAFDQIRSHSILSEVYDGAETLLYIPAAPVRLCDRCRHALARRNREDLCFCCQRKESELKAHVDGLRKKPVASERRWDYDEARARVAC